MLTGALGHVSGPGLGRTGLAATSASIGLTFAVAVAGPSVMEPGLPGRPGQPPWSLGLAISPYLAVALTAAALAAGAAGLGMCLYAARRGWTVPPWALLAAGVSAAALLALVQPFGSSDHLSYAAYGRMVVTGHDPYTTTPWELARAGDPVARAVQDWKNSPSVYGPLATGLQALASLAGGDSARLTVFVVSLINAAAFAGTGLLLHWLARGSRQRQLRAGLLWTLNPLLLQVLVAGAHVDSQALFFAVAAVCLFAVALRSAGRCPAAPIRFAAAAGAGATAGLAAAVKVSFVLLAVGLGAAALLAWWPRTTPEDRARWRVPGLWIALGGLAAGLVVAGTVGLIPWGIRPLSTALHAGSYVSIGSPWRAVRSALRLAIRSESAADNAVKVGALLLAAVVAVLFARPLADLARQVRRGQMGSAVEPVSPAVLAGACVFVAGFAWLVAWPYVLPWYDALAWAPLAILPWLPQPWASLDGLLLTRTAALAFGYLPARGITMPAGLGWLESVVRTGVTPAVLLGVTVVLVVKLWPTRPWRRVPAPWHGQALRAGTMKP
ncbi:MAG TPA: polyprenol phosphomannose-dependent alpha 1,6 mannosyltransferase MptB [Streptosporangiaceae bacterium]|nr:polyprenol phosphomannose-dependent alpha 1,6 mannosyltransferase MptB [Streptosporangiaceae bacterium]